MDDPAATWLVRAALRCYPDGWRRRHGHEAGDLAALLIRDGTPAGSIACSYLAGAAREWLTPRPGRRLSTVVYALLIAVCLLSISAELLAPTAPAKAASTSQAHARAHCRTGSAEPVRGVTVPASRPEARVPQVGHGRFC